MTGYPDWRDAPLPGGPLPTTPGGSRTMQGGGGLRTAALVGPGHRVPILFGRDRISPDIVYAGMGGNYRGEFRVVLSEGPIDGVESWLTDADTFDTLPVTLGTMTTPVANLQGTIGLAAAFIRTKPGRPYQPRCIARGRTPYDPRLGAWGAGDYPDPAYCVYSTNPALVMADLKTFPQYASWWPIVTPDRVDWSSVGAAADWCDTLVSGAKRYELNLYLQNGGDAKIWEDTIGLHTGLRWREEGGLWHLDFSAPETTAADPITDDHVKEGTEPRLTDGAGSGLADRPNRFRAEWIDPDSGWVVRTVEVRHPEVDAGAAIRDSQVYRFHGFHSEAMALRALWRVAHEIWSEQELSCDLTTERLDLVEGSRVPVTLPSIGLTAVDFIVTRVTYDSDTVSITARRYDSTTWSDPGATSGALDDPGFFDIPGDLTNVNRVSPENAVSATTPTSKTTLWYLGFSWQLPSFPWPKDVVVRVWPAGTSPTWDTAGYQEFTFQPKGDARYAADPTWKAVATPMVWVTVVETYDSLGTLINTASTWDGFDSILRLRSLAGQLSPGVALNKPANSSSTPTPADVVPVVVGSDVTPTDGQIGAWDSVTGQLGFPQALTLVGSGAAAVVGGRVVIGATTKLAADLAAAATTISVAQNILSNGDRLYMEAAPGGVSQVEYLAVTSAASGTGPYTYSVTRDLAGGGASDWKKGDAILNTGQAGTRFIDIYSARGMKSASEVGSTMVGNVRESSTYNDWSPRWAIGRLDGLYGYGSNIYGAVFGSPSGAWLKIDNANGIRIGHNTTTKISLSPSGDASFSGTVTAAAGSIGGVTIASGKLYLGAGNFFASDTPFFVADTGHFSLSNKLKFDTSDLTIVCGNVTLNASGVAIPEGGAASANGYNLSASGVPYGGVYGSSGNLLVGRISGAMLQFESTKIVAVGYHEADAFTTRTAAPTSGYFDTDNGYKVGGTTVVTSRQFGVSGTPASRTAGASYGSTERTMLQEAHDAVRTLLGALRTHGLIS